MSQIHGAAMNENAENGSGNDNDRSDRKVNCARKHNPRKSDAGENHRSDVRSNLDQDVRKGTTLFDQDLDGCEQEHIAGQ